jgi:carboxyl-terminal processing protease
MKAHWFVWVSLPALVAGSAAGLWLARGIHRHPSPVATEVPLPSAEPDAGTLLEEDDRAFSFHIPSGEPSSLTCDAARSVIVQVRGNLAFEPEPISAHALAAGTTDWLDPHGLWSAAPNSPTAGVIERYGAPLLRELENETGGRCEAALAIGRALVPWTLELAKRFDKERSRERSLPAGDTAGDTKTDPEELLKVAAEESPFEDDAPTRSARDLAALLGRRVGTVERMIGPSARPYADAARARFLPGLDAEGWQRVVLAAAVRAYVQATDPHGAWAPLDEEASVYEMDLESPAPARLWDKASRTAIGVRLEGDPAEPLQVGDVVLSIAGVPTAGLPLEQVEQLGLAAAEGEGPVAAVVLRPGERSLRDLKIGDGTEDGRGAAPSDDELPRERVPYGAGDALVVSIHDIKDDLGDELSQALDFEKEHEARPLEGVVLDLRGNGGGSTEGAIAALGLFIPGAPLFPMKRRDGSIETDRAPEPPNIERWTGPVATLVDGDTASAAEMIAGALSVYHRAPTVGSLTYGKGCAQEYMDDDARTGILRLTTLLYALPDGSPVQRVGLAPSLLLGWGEGGQGGPPGRAENKSKDDSEREATLSHAPPTWRGPDVRDHAILASSEAVQWTSHGGAVGPCKDPDVCRALRSLGATSKRAPTAKGHPSEGTR